MTTLLAFKRIASITEFRKLHPAARRIILDLLNVWPDAYMEITRIYSPPMPDESGVHRTHPHRAFDIRTNDMSAEQGEMMVDYVNGRYRYEPSEEHQCARQHGKGANRHLHCQVKWGNLTRRRPMRRK